MLNLSLHPLQYRPKEMWVPVRWTCPVESVVQGEGQDLRIWETLGMGVSQSEGEQTHWHIRRWLGGKFLAHCSAGDGLVAQKRGWMQVRLFQVSWEFDKPSRRQEAQPVHSLLQNTLCIPSNAFTHFNAIIVLRIKEIKKIELFL